MVSLITKYNISKDILFNKKGLDQQHSVQILTDLVKEAKEKHKNISAIVGTVVGVAVAVATLALLIVGSCVFPPYSGLETLCLVGITGFGWAIAGAAAGGLTYGLGMWISNYKTNKISKFILNLQNTYENDAQMEKDEIIEMLKKCYDAQKIKLLQGMNFEQLLNAKTALGDKKFTKFLNQKDAGGKFILAKEEHALFRFILSLSAQSDLKKTFENPSALLDKYLHSSSLFVEALQEQLIDVDLTKILKNSAVTDDDDDTKITINIEGGGSIIVDKQKLIHASDCFKAMFADKRYTEAKENEVTIEKDESEAFPLFINFITKKNLKITKKNVAHLSEAFQLFINFITKKNLKITKKNVAHLFDMAAKYQATDLIYQIDRFLCKNLSGIDEEGLWLFLENCPNLKMMKKKLHNSFLKTKLNDDNLDSFWEIAKNRKINELEKKCKDYVKSRTKESVENATPDCKKWLKKCFKRLSDAEYSDFRTTLTVSYKNIRPLYEFADKKDDELKKNCLAFIKDNKDFFWASDIWGVNELPTDVYEALAKE